MNNTFRMLCLLATTTAIISGCGNIEVPRTTGKAIFHQDARLQSPGELPDVSLSILKTAEISSLDALFVSGGNWTEIRKGAHSAILVRHPQGNVLFDSGLGMQIDTQFEQSVPFWLKPLMAYKKIKPAQQLLANGSNDKIRMLILSHMHWDHASGIKDFPDAEIWTTPEEYKHAINPDTPERAFIKSQFDGATVKWKFIQFADIPYENFMQSLDVFKDGSVVLVPLPGHTPGALGMFVNLRSGRRMFFTGDTTWTVEGFTRPAHKFWISSLLVDDDKVMTGQTILKVHRLMQEYPALEIIPAHDNKVQSKIGFYPEFIH